MAFDLQPVLNGTLLELRPLRADEFDVLFAVAGDRGIWEQHPDRHRYREDRFRVFFDEAIASGGALVAIDVATGRIVGSSRFHGYDPVTRKIEIGWTFLARACWGGRYNGEMKRLMLDHAFQFVETVVFLIGPENIRSQRAVGRIGGVHLGTRLRDDGREAVTYQISAEAWRGLARKTEI
jgi:N-acetyltransferase